MRNLSAWSMFVAAAFAVTATAGAAPVIHCAERTHDFGTVEDLDLVEHTFKIHNAGDSDLLIESVKTSCGCTTTQLKSKTVPPGGDVDLHAKLSLVGRSGLQTKIIDIVSNDPSNSTYKLELKCNSLRSIDIRPPQVMFRVDETFTNATRSVRVTFNGSTKIHVIGLETNKAPHFGASFKEIRPGAEYQIDLTLNSIQKNMPPLISEQIRILTDSTTATNLTFPVMIFHQLPIMVSPPDLRLYDYGKGGFRPTNHLIVVRARVRNGIAKLVKVEAPSVARITTNVLSEGSCRLNVLLAVTNEVDVTAPIRLEVESNGGKRHQFEIPIKVMPLPSRTASPAPAH